MESTGEEPGHDHVPSQALGERLSTLKAEGSALLVVGALAPEQYRHACHQMLGDEAAAPRRRIFVTTDQTASAPQDRLPPTAGPPRAETTTQISYATQSRSATAAPAPSPPDIPTERIDEPNLSTLGIRISEVITEFERLAPELAPAELRVCFDSLRPLLGEHDTNTVFQFLHLLTGRIRAVRGMGHFHLPVARERESVRVLAPLFDAIVELRSDGETIQQRWRLPDEDLTSAWIPVQAE